MDSVDSVSALAVGEGVLRRRKYAYIVQPKAFEVAPCPCGNSDTEWSEYEGRCWCSRCGKDYAPEHFGVLDRLIHPTAARAMKVMLDRVNLQTMDYERFKVDRGEYVVVGKVQKKPIGQSYAKGQHREY